MYVAQYAVKVATYRDNSDQYPVHIINVAFYHTVLPYVYMLNLYLQRTFFLM